MRRLMSSQAISAAFFLPQVRINVPDLASKELKAP
jgi:hypothetical protein